MNPVLIGAEVADAGIVDGAPTRSDGYDLTDWLFDNPSSLRWLAEPASQRGS